MSAQDRNKARAEEDRARAAIAHVLEADKLPETAQSIARALHERMETPVSVAIMGLPGTGRSQVFNLLAGSEIIPELPSGTSLPTIEFRHGETEKAELTLAGGEKVLRDDIDLAAIAAQAPAMVKMWADKPALKRITLLEVVAGADPAQQARAMIWAAKRANMAIWCTRDFGAAEQAVWAAAPDALKTDSILLRTHADLVREKDALLRVLRYNAGDGFDQVLAIDTPAALAARDADGGPDRKAFKQAGGQGLISTVLRMVERNRALLVDQVDLLLMRHLGTTDPMRPGTAAPAKPKKAAAPAKPAAADTAIDTEAQTALEAGVTRLAKAGEALLAEDAAPADVMDRAVAELIWLSEHLDMAESDAPNVIAMRDRATDAADLAQLMQLEDSADAALEATSLMIQMRRSLSQELAQKPAA